MFLIVSANKHFINPDKKTYLNIRIELQMIIMKMTFDYVNGRFRKEAR